MNTHSTTMKVLLSLAALIFCASAMDQVTFLEPNAAYSQDDEKKMPSEELGGLDDSADEDLILVPVKFSEGAPIEDASNIADADKFTISKKAAFMAVLVKEMFEGDQAETDILLNSERVDAPTLELIAEYLQHHNGKEQAEIAKPIRDTNMEKIVQDPFDAEFINKQTKKVVFKIILGANYLDCKSLLHLGCAKIATLIKGKSPEEIKKILGTDDKVTSRRLMDLMGL